MDRDPRSNDVPHGSSSGQNFGAFDVYGNPVPSSLPVPPGLHYPGQHDDRQLHQSHYSSSFGASQSQMNQARQFASFETQHHPQGIQPVDGFAPAGASELYGRGLPPTSAAPQAHGLAYNSGERPSSFAGFQAQHQQAQQHQFRPDQQFVSHQSFQAQQVTGQPAQNSIHVSQHAQSQRHSLPPATAAEERDELFRHYPPAPTIAPPVSNSTRHHQRQAAQLQQQDQQQDELQQQQQQQSAHRSSHQSPSSGESPAFRQGLGHGGPGFHESQRFSPAVGGLPGGQGHMFGMYAEGGPLHSRGSLHGSGAYSNGRHDDSTMLPDLSLLSLDGGLGMDAHITRGPQQAQASPPGPWSHGSGLEHVSQGVHRGAVTLEQLEGRLLNESNGRGMPEQAQIARSPFLASLVQAQGSPADYASGHALPNQRPDAKLAPSAGGYANPGQFLHELHNPSNATNPTAGSPALGPAGLAGSDLDRADRKAARTARFLWKPVGHMEVSPNQTGPNQYIQVNWVLPASYVSPSAYARNADENAEQCDWVGLFRARTRIDAPDGYILSRNVLGRSRIDPATGMISGMMRLRTPRGVGQYNFRYFRGSEPGQDAARREGLLPLARSNTVRVEVQGADMFEALDFVQRNLGDRKKLSNATMQFATLLRQLRTLRAPLKDAPADRGNGSNSGGSAPGGGRGRQVGGRFSQRGGQATSRQEEKQEALLYRELWNTVSNCMSYVQRRCQDLTAAIRQEEPIVAERREHFDALNDVKEQLKQEALDSGVGDPDTGDNGANAAGRGDVGDGDADLSVLPGMMSEDDFNKWKEAKDRLLAAERSLSQNVRDRATLSSSLRAVLVSFLSCEPVRPLMSQEESAQIHSALSLYCPVDEVFFESDEALANHFAQEFGMRFLSSPVELRAFLIFGSSPSFAARLKQIELGMLTKLDEIVPDPAVERDRIAFVDQLQRVVDIAAKRWGCDGRVVPFGSSINNFGTATSDLDICLVLIPRGARWPDAIHEDPPAEEDGAPTAEQAVTDLAEVFAESGFENIDDSRKTARIPILQFRHAPLELECDIGVNNRLAIRNTLLLRTYSEIDPRLRQLAYIIKLWSRRRDINNPAQRTLSSYGYLLILIHFLQQLRVPILPPLQALPPHWEGGAVQEDVDLPIVLVPSQDGKQHNTYFYGDPQSHNFASPAARAHAMDKLRRYASRNTTSIGELLLHFFWTVAFGFDWRRNVIGIRDMSVISKESKASEDSWKLHQRMAIEDPFETSYDVAHVVRDKEFKLMRREFARAYAVLSGSAVDAPPLDTADPLSLIDLLCEPRAAEVAPPSAS